MDTIKLNKALGWFSIALGLAEVAFGRRIANAIGSDSPALLRGYGARELATGAGILVRPDSSAGLWARVGGDLLDAATVGRDALRPSNPRKTGAYIALGVVAGALLVDLYAARASTRRTSVRT